MASKPRIRPIAFDAEVDMRCNSVNQWNCSGLLSGMKIDV